MRRPISRNPVEARKRIRKNSQEIERDIEILYGKPVSEWDFEELQKGKPREANGNFSRGPKPKWITDILMGEVRRRLKEVTRDEMATFTGAAMSTFAELMADDRVDENGKAVVPASVKLEAAKYLTDQLIGKATSKVEVSGSMELQHMLADVMVNPDGEDSHPVVQGYVEENGDEEDDEDDGE